jgi:pilus assembly protein CpaB
LLVGSLAALFAYLYVSSAQDRAFTGAKLVPALVMSGDVPKGMTGDEALSKGLVKADSVPAKYRPALAVADKNAIHGKIALTNLASGQVLVQGMFADPVVAQETAAKRVPAGQVAVTITVDDVTGVGGLITPGDKVNILTAADGVERTLFENVDVLYIGATAAPSPDSPDAVKNPGSNLITFAVPPVAAQKIVFASHLPNGIHLVLVRADNKAAPVAPTNAQNLFSGGTTPYEG